MIKEFLTRAQNDQPIYITEVEAAFSAMPEKSRVIIQTELVEPGQVKDVQFYLPTVFEERAFVEDFFFGKIYNIISTLGGKKLTVFYDTQNDEIKRLVKKTEKVFGIHETKKKRTFYGRSINVADRINEALYGGSFVIEACDIAEYQKKR